jgi:two-component system, NtrC family, response regulator HydG
MEPVTPKTSVLIVDDDPSLRWTMSLILQRKGYVTETAANGAEAVAIIRENPFDMVLMDIRMPVMDGVQALKQIKAIRPHTVVTIMTAYAVDDLIQDALDEGAFAILNKPVEIEEVIALIKQALQDKQSALIMIVDADQSMRSLLQEILTREGYNVCLTGSGEDAIALARTRTFDILLIDLKLPELNGLETYLAIKAIRPHIVAIVFTAYPQDMTQIAEQALKNNAYACLYKPLDIDRLLALIREIVEQKRAAQDGNPHAL